MRTALVTLHMQEESGKCAYRQHKLCDLEFPAYQFHTHLLGTKPHGIGACNPNDVQALLQNK